LAFLVIGAIVVYIYIIKGSPEDDRKLNVVQNVKPTSTVNIIERDYEFAVTYPYQKSDQQIEISGYDENLFLISDAQQIDNKVSKTETPVDSKLKTKPDKNIKSENKPVTEIKSQPPVEEKPVVEPEKKVEKINRIFLYKNFYVVYVASFKSEEEANREADSYFDLGYNAVVEVVERGRNSEYRLIVGDFTSEEFARQFQQKYIK
jgi:cell division septation protein DedD